MARKLFLGSLWLIFVIYGVFTATFFSGTFAEDLDLITKLTLREWAGINPLIIAIFYIMGVFPLLYAAFLLFDNSDEQKISPYPFAIAAMGFGAFALLPYFVLRQPNSAWNGQKNLWLKILDSRLMAIMASVTIIVLLIWGVTQGNWSDFMAQWQTTQFINIMSLDFCVLCFLFLAILPDDLERRNVKPGLLKTVAFIPLIGALIYWCCRPQLPETEISPQLNIDKLPSS